MAIEYKDYTMFYACGHTATHRSSGGGDIHTAAFCPKCNQKQDREINALSRKLTGEIPESSDGFGWILRWRLRATEEEVASTFTKAGLPCPKLIRDSGNIIVTETRVHQAILAEMRSKRGKCACGCISDWDYTLSGTAGCQQAVWACCPIHTSNCCSLPIVGSEVIGRFTAARESADRCDITLDDMVGR